MKPPILRDRITALTTCLSTLADPTDAGGWLSLLRLLYAVGREDLPLGRLFEGHVDALQIVHRYGDAGQRDAAARAARGGAAFGVWNADRADDPIAFDGTHLSGGKAFASGAGLLSHALVPVDGAGGRQLLLLDLGETPPAIDRGWWHVSGMQRSETHRVAWSEAAVPPAAIVGRPGDYVREPWFSGGALRFAAVQAGGVAAVVDGVRDHLTAQARADDPHQAGRLAALYGMAQAAADAVARAGAAWRADDTPVTLAHVAAARAAVYEAGGRVIALAQEAVGVQAMFLDHPLSGTLTDLAAYLRQPGPDAQRMRVAAAVAAGLLSPSL